MIGGLAGLILIAAMTPANLHCSHSELISELATRLGGQVG
jgi:hypothetical protein